MSLGKTVGTILLLGGIAAIAVESGCATNKPSISQNTLESASKQKIDYIVNHQRAFSSYGGNLQHPSSYSGSGEVLKHIFDDGFQTRGHTFGTRIKADKNGFVYISLFADNIFIVDIDGNGVDGGSIFAESYDVVRGNIGNPRVQEIPFSGDGSNKKANEFQDAVLDVIVEKYRTGDVSQATIIQYETAKSNLLDSLK